MNPYKILGVPQKATIDEVKKAYRALARQHHPDRHIGKPDAAEAETRMREINEAYDTIIKKKNLFAGEPEKTLKKKKCKDKRHSKQTPARFEANQPFYEKVKKFLHLDDIDVAAATLLRTPERDAEWYFLMGEIWVKKGWYDDAGRAYTKASRADPTNKLYHEALNKLNSIEGYRGYDSKKDVNFKNFWDNIRKTAFPQNRF